MGDRLKLLVKIRPYTGELPKGQGYSPVGTALEFELFAQNGTKSVEIREFGSYVRRTIRLTEGELLMGATTGAVIRNGAFVPMPTTFDGKGNAAISSRTNSVYTLLKISRSFPDTTGKWYEGVAGEAAKRLIMSGDDSGSFKGDNSITRAEFVQILVNGMGLGAEGDSGFNDVPQGAWYAPAVTAAQKYGLASGYDDGSFKPNGKISRQEAMLMLYKAAAICGVDKKFGSYDSSKPEGGIAPPMEISALFYDADKIAVWAREAAYWCASNGVMKGENYQIRPLDNVTRAEAAAVMLRFLATAGLINYTE